MKMMLFFAWLIMPFPSLSDPVIFNRTFGGAANDFAHAVVQTADGGYIVCGQTDSYGLGSNLKPDMWIIKIDNKGDKVWDKTFGGRESDIAFAIQQTADKGFIVAGTTSSYGKGYPSIWILKLNANGDSVWTSWFEGSMTSTARSIVQTADGGYIVAGSGKENILKLDQYGKRVWGKKYSWVLYSVEQTSDGGYIAVGDTIFKPQEWDYIPAVTVVKLDREGNREWSNPLGDRFQGSAFSVHQTADDGYIFSGDSIAEKSAYDHSHYALAVKLDKLGNIVWKHFGTEYSAAQSICQTEKGEYAVTGNTLDENHGLNLLVYLLDSDGNEKWRKSFGNTTQWEYASSISQTSDQGFIITGQTESAGAGKYDVWTLKLDENGNLNPTGIPSKEIPKNESPFLVQNYPNPFSVSTTITFDLPEPEFVTLFVFDLAGKILETNDFGYFPPGESSIIWNRKDLPGGIYMFRLQTRNWDGFRKFILP